MKRRICLLFLISIFLLVDIACSNQPTNPITENSPENTASPGQPKQQITEVDFDFDKTRPCIISKGCWYDENSILLAINTKPAETQSLKLVSWRLDNGDLVTVYQNPFFVDNADQMIVNKEAMGYQNNTQAILIDTKTLELQKEVKAEAGTRISFSPNMEYMAEANNEGLYILDTGPSKQTLLDDNSNGYLYLCWSSDNSKLLYMDNTYSKINIIDVESGKKQTLCASTDFNVPDGLVDIIACRFLPGSSDVLLNILCENNEAITVLSEASGYQSDSISAANSITYQDASQGRILYVLDDKTEYKLMCWDYINGDNKELHSSNALIDCAFFSPAGDKIMFCTRDEQNQHLFIYQ